MEKKKCLHVPWDGSETKLFRNELFICYGRYRGRNDTLNESMYGLKTTQLQQIETNWIVHSSSGRNEECWFTLLSGKVWQL